MGSSPAEPDWAEKREALEDELRDWWEWRSGDFDSGFDSNDSGEDSGLWDQMPEIDSKAAARTAPMCEEILDVKFEITMIREGGYQSIDDLIDHLIPQLLEKAMEQEAGQ